MTFFSTLGRPDPTPWLLGAGEPAARWLALRHLLGLPEDAPEVVATHEAVIADPGAQALLAQIPDWEVDNGLTGHDKPLLATNLLDLLGEMGVGPKDDSRIGRLLDQLAEHADEYGRFQMFAAEPGADEPRWAALLCDTHAIADVLLRFGLGADPRVRRALMTAVSDLARTDQGLAWPCRPADGGRWRGPGRVRDCCPQTTLEALRAFSRLPPAERPRQLTEVARTVLEVWRSRASQKPYMFGHGRRFKQVKWPLPGTALTR
ncbi:MAG: hypothetical protein ABH877_03985 [bacterium]